jgi:hypothetical protein
MRNSSSSIAADAHYITQRSTSRLFYPQVQDQNQPEEPSTTLSGAFCYYDSFNIAQANNSHEKGNFLNSSTANPKLEKGKTQNPRTSVTEPPQK